MSNEIRSSATLSITKDSDVATGNAATTLNLTGTKFMKSVQSVGSSYEPVNFGDLTDCKVIYLRNHGASPVSCSFDADDSKWFATLYEYTSSAASDFMLFTPHQLTQSIYLKSNTGTCNVSIVASES